MRETGQPGINHIEIDERIVSEGAAIWMRSTFRRRLTFSVLLQRITA
jgi:hypothetical protein